VVWQWVHRTAETAPDPLTAKPSRVAVDETAVTIGTEQHWLHTATAVKTKLLLLGAIVSERRGTDPVAEKHDFSETAVLVDGVGYLTAPARRDLRRAPQLPRAESDRNVVPDAHHADRPIPSDVEGRQSQRRALVVAFLYYYNCQRPNQAARQPHARRGGRESLITQYRICRRICIVRLHRYSGKNIYCPI